MTGAGTFVAVWPVDGEHVDESLTRTVALDDLHRLAQLAGVRLSGVVAWTFTPAWSAELVSAASAGAWLLVAHVPAVAVDEDLEPVSRPVWRTVAGPDPGSELPADVRDAAAVRQLLEVGVDAAEVARVTGRPRAAVEDLYLRARSGP